MIEHFLNPWMLVGLAGVALPLAVHLARHRHVQRVDWGAMQFLELEKHAQRRTRIEQCLLLFVRILLVATVVLAMSRPWVQFGWLSATGSASSRDLALIIDDSYSMEARSSGMTAHARALSLARQLVGGLQPGDSVSLFVARERPQAVVAPSSRDFARVREALDRLPPPAGSSNIPAALAQALRLQSRAAAPVRQIVVLTDGQAYAWRADDQTQWANCTAVRELAAVPSHVFAVVAGAALDKSPNASLDHLRLFPERTVVGFPVRLTSRIYANGFPAGEQRRVALEINGLRIPSKTVAVAVGPEGFADVSIEHRFDAPGSYAIGLVLDDDALLGDNRAAAAVTVEEALKVLLVDGAPDPDATRSETYFARAALAPQSNAAAWVRASVVAWDQLAPGAVSAHDVVILANVPRVEPSVREALEKHVASGGCALFALGDRLDKNHYNETLFEPGKGLLPTELQQFLPPFALDADDRSAGAKSAGATIDETSLELPWLKRFREDRTGGLLDARFRQWWIVSDRTEDAAYQPLVIARLSSGDPLLLTRRLGKGTVAVMTAPLDADASNLPAKLDFVPFLYELIFHAAAGRTNNNLWVGEPIVAPIPVAVEPKRFVFIDPLRRERTPQIVSLPATESAADLSPDTSAGAASTVARLTETMVPGVYRFDERRAAHAEPTVVEPAAFMPQHFVADFDRKERDLTLLDALARRRLAEQGDIEFLVPEQADAIQLPTERAPFELSQPLLLASLGLVVLELAVARLLVRPGNVAK